MHMTDVSTPVMPGEPGLRSRKKAKRRDEIIAAARRLFDQQGVDATTMADIAAAAGISPPTVFNYFGSKDGVLIALISEGTTEAREQDRNLHWRERVDLGELLVGFFLRVSLRTLEIADKRVWRYAEAAAIRQPATELAVQYQSVSEALVNVVAEYIADLDIHTRSGGEVSPAFIGRLLHDVWMPCFISLITNEDQSLAEHEAVLQMRIPPLVNLLFDEQSIKSPKRKGQPA